MRKGLALTGFMTILATSATAGPVGSACLDSGRGASRPLCACIGNVADMTLSGPDQKLAARLFSDPDKAEEIRVSDSNRHKSFWSRYQSFAATAGSLCVSG
jgi:hypothetical protein